MSDREKTRDELLAELAAQQEKCALASRIVSKVPAIICMIAPDGTILFINPAGEEVTGYGSAELIGTNWWQTFYPGAEYLQVERLFEALDRGNVSDYEMVLTTRSGEKRIVSWSSINRYDDAGRITEIVGFGTDVTGRRQAEEALRRNEAHLRVILEATADGILAVYAQGKTIQANRIFADLWRIPLAIMDSGDDAAMLSFVLDQLSDPDAFLKKVKALYGTAELDMDEVHFKDGRVFERYSAPLLLEGAVVGRVWSFRDVTERRRADEALRKSEKMYRLLTETSPNAITVADPTGRICMANRRALDLFGHADDSGVLGRSLFEWVAPEHRQKAVEALGELVTRDALTDLEYLLLREDGSCFWGVSNVSLIRSPAGEPQLAIVVTTDITQRKQLEEERLKLQKLESVGILAGGIAHDFNNLLQGVFGYISMARASLGSGENTADLLEQAEQALKMSINLTNQLLTFAKGGQPVRKKLDLVPVIENAARFALSGARSTYRLASAGSPWPVIADEGQVGQVIQNIVLNASEAMPDGGTVEISLHRMVIPPGAHLSLPEGGEFVRADIRDSGIGIPAQYLARIFDPYFTTKHKGSGLGLATAFAIARNHGGVLEVASEPDRGSTFSLYIPASPEAEETKALPPVAPSRRKGRILVMDDEDVVRLVVSRMVLLLGHEVECAEDGEGALAKVREAYDAGVSFDVVILDLTVKGGIGGEEVVDRLREIDPRVKVIVSSGYADNPVLADFRSYGFSARMIKPYTMEALRDALDDILA